MGFPGMGSWPPSPLPQTSASLHQHPHMVTAAILHRGKGLAMRLGRVGIRVTLHQGRGLAMNLGRVEIRHLRAKDGCYTPTPGELIWARARQASHPLIQLLNTSGHRSLRSSHAQWLNRVQPLWPHGLQSIRLLCPWDFPGKNTGVGCHFLRGLPSTMNRGSRPMEIGSHLAWTHWLKPLQRLHMGP